MDENQLDTAAAPAVGERDGAPEPIREEDGVKETPSNDGKQDSSTSTGDAGNFTAMLQGLTDKALHFLAHASNETLGACLVGLGASTYIVLGRVGLLFIGVAGGVVLHATWEGVRGDDRDEATKQLEQDRKREAGVEVARRLLGLREDGSAEEEGDVKVLASTALDFDRFEPQTAAALDTFANAVIKDYVHYWYDPTLPNEPTFPASCKRTLTAFLLSLSAHLERKRPADAFLDFVTNASSIIIVLLNELSAALNASPNAAAPDAITAYLELKPESSLASVLDTKLQNRKLNTAAEDILQSYLDPKAYNCPPVHVFLKEVLSQLVLGATITLCSRPEWINEWIVYGLEESATTKEVMDMVDAGVEGRPAAEPQQTDENAKPARKAQEDQVGSPEQAKAKAEHKRKMSKAEDAMDDAMKEARRLTQMMIEEDERRVREEQERQSRLSSSEEASEAGTTHGAPTPTSSQSDNERQEAETAAWGDETTKEPESAEQSARPGTPTSKQPFTSFDQLGANSQPTALSDSPNKPRQEPPQLTLLNANINIFDDSAPGERSSIKSKPADDYLVQIEPANSAFPGWMIVRKYADFEVLHEVLRRISVITGSRFIESHAELPKWKVHTKASLRAELERYLTDAVRFQSLAESEGMKRFLEKDQGMSKSPGAGNKAFGWPTPEAFGKFGGNMIDVLAKAPKDVAGGVAGGGKAFFGGVAGLVGAKKGMPSQAGGNLSRTNTNASTSSGHKSTPSMGQPFATDTYLGSMSAPRQSTDSLRSMPKPSLDRKGSAATLGSVDLRAQGIASPQRPSSDWSRSPSVAQNQLSPRPSVDALSVTGKADDTFDLPPPPSDIPDDYASPSRITRTRTDTRASTNPTRASFEPELPPQTPPRPAQSSTKADPRPSKPPLNDQEASVAIELIFAVITELYTLSSAWNIRRTFLTAAKTYLLRPGNPQLTSIRDLLQSSLLDTNLSDSGLAGHIYKMRENALPTAEEMEVWLRDYPEKTPEEKEHLRKRARELLVSRGMPQALSSVMGAAASGEALGRVFDCLQVPDVSRGLVYGLMLQALKVVTH